ncbi:O-antigen ligase family protein [Rathayibacter iranicus]|uniref:Uncharacterized protein n=2 Tax=Rathayibacter iranicus TaxID=59737 RepID=A0AAD1AE86_9MICO|nr:hypothetical protein [Rathayibacter iranicus]AZZ55630.1 hypothetical protein C7V51_06830 [Rathayibacter iranicus]MWV31107.1 hypothetical protein [Rathayibacter iranicus NCPPB 2253 = VKM Ac-1602]PPI47900.1 hypothetical protein C5E09_05880 [Rathayibacter iranicus]PPI61051.1 hypothetical protein C5E08_06810 [Rathayibacter iranicus]PPI72972.1 hypothetical protein C5E01_03840 [Rathayibacter iranicus]
MNLIAIALAASGILYIIFGKREAVLKRANVYVLVLISIVPLYAAPNNVVVITFGIASLVLLLVCVQASVRIRIDFTILPILILLSLELFSRLRGGSPQLALFNTVIIVFAFLAILVCATAVRESGWFTFAMTLAVLLPFHLVVSVLEQGGVVSTLWPRGTEIDDISHRPNRLLEILPGRSMSTLGHPIVLGFICGVTAILALHYFLNSSRWWGVVFLLAVVISGLSGARSAFFATVVACLYLFLRSRKSGTRVVIMGLALAVGVLLYQGGYFAEDTFSEVETQSSYTHRLSVTTGVQDYIGQASPESLAFGRGIYDYLQFLTNGIFGSREDLTSFDNQIVRSLVVSGLVGVAAVVLTMVVGWVRGSGVARATLVYSAVLMFSFDMFTWIISLVIFGIATTAGTQQRDDNSPSPSPLKTSTRRTAVSRARS